MGRFENIFPKVGVSVIRHVDVGFGFEGEGKGRVSVMAIAVCGEGRIMGRTSGADKKQCELGGQWSGGKDKGGGRADEENGGGQVWVSCSKRALENFIFLIRSFEGHVLPIVWCIMYICCTDVMM